MKRRYEFAAAAVAAAFHEGSRCPPALPDRCSSVRSSRAGVRAARSPTMCAARPPRASNPPRIAGGHVPDATPAVT
ncbi:unnamed protein product [Lampetra planeri]